MGNKTGLGYVVGGQIRRVLASIIVHSVMNVTDVPGKTLGIFRVSDMCINSHGWSVHRPSD